MYVTTKPSQIVRTNVFPTMDMEPSTEAVLSRVGTASEFHGFPTMDFAPSTISYDQKVKVMAIMAEAICLLKVAMKQVEDLELTLWQILEMPDPWMGPPPDKRSMESAEAHDSFAKRRRIRLGGSDETLVLGQTGTSSTAVDDPISQFPATFVPE